jgi:cell division protein FtsZ
VGVSLMDAFRSADEVLLSGVQGITNLITTPGLINLDFADVKSVMSGAGSALMGIGSSRGEGRAVQAAGKAINSPLLEASMDGAQGVLLSIAGGSDLGLFEINEAASLVQEAAHPEANIIFGTVIDDSLGDEVRVTVIAAGFEAGGPTHKKLETQAYGTRSGGVVASGVSGTTATSQNGHSPNGSGHTGNGNGATGHRPGQVGSVPATNHASGLAAAGQAPAPRVAAAESSAPPAYAPPAEAPPAPSTNGDGHHGSALQTGTLPPASPPPAAYTPPTPRLPEHGEAPTSPGLYTPPAAHSPSPTSYASPVTRSDFDDDVDVPPFMKR